ncbi:glycosyltransferase family 2 protein [Pedobacter fastidiosus]|uniref:Glycosyltransferase family 2 protein n=1 Tax=Pedobacter fastidiosus TaxID=2765361 RepID=A0ABR7KUZ4_9SPHI|nr:glycosyltransferase family 2 protein [Pedobacter fastidiosus]MBC6111853.1 glycosyltransferase family 2 protein [Pedobacter fastidiosus]
MKFTIGIPAYKAKFLKDCIDSILGQNYSDFELIIVNDASPENIDEIVANYNDTRLTYYKNDKNFGAINVVDNWNKCLSFAQGEYFILMGDDDLLDPNYLKEFDLLISNYPLCNIFHCRTLIINEKSEPIELTDPRPDFETVYDSILERMKGSRLFFISDYVYRTSTLKSNGGFYKLPLAWASDDISSFIASKEHGIANTNKPLFKYRRNNQTISTTGNTNFKMDAILAEEQWLNEFVQKVPDNVVDVILLETIKKEIKKFIQKKKIRTIYSANDISFYKWFGQKSKYGISIEEILYAFLLSIKEKRKKQYNEA